MSNEMGIALNVHAHLVFRNPVSYAFDMPVQLSHENQYHTTTDK
jgi:hypothetical protein